MKINQIIRDQSQPQPVNCIQFNKTGAYCLTGGKDRMIKLWNPHSAQLIQSFSGHAHQVLTLDILKDNSKFCSGGEDKQVLLWDVVSGKILKQYFHYQRVLALHFHSNQQLMASGSLDGLVRLWDVRYKLGSNQPVQLLDQAKDAITGVQFVGDYEILSSSLDGCLRTYDIRKGSLTTDHLHHGITNSSVSNDGNYILTSHLNQPVSLVDKETGECLQKFSGHLNKQYTVQAKFTMEDDFIISGSEDGHLFKWDIVDPDEQKEKLKISETPILALDIYQKTLLTTSADGFVFVLQLE